MSEMPDKIPGEPELSEAELKKMFPTMAKQLAETTISDFLKTMLLQRAGNNLILLNVYLGIFSGLPMADFDVPEWVKRASRKFLEGIGLKMMRLDNSNNWVTWMEALGQSFGRIEDLLQKRDESSVAESKQKKILEPMMGEFKTFAANSKAEDSAAFFNGRLEGEISRGVAGQMSVPTKIYFLIAVRWQLVAQMNSTAELHEFLTEDTMPNGTKIFPPNYDSRETRRACEIIGLRFENSWNKEKPKI